jgi:hypothetical protein
MPDLSQIEYPTQIPAASEKGKKKKMHPHPSPTFAATA